ncbi:hypothetical protein D3C87_2006090 [compost metagenome]
MTASEVINVANFMQNLFWLNEVKYNNNFASDPSAKELSLNEKPLSAYNLCDCD